MKQLFALLFVCVSLLFSPFTLADIYIGGGAYLTNVDEKVEDLKLDEDDVVPGFFVGWKPMPMFAIEGGYYDMGSYSKTYDSGKVSYDAQAFSIAAVGNLPLWIFDIYGKIGATYTDTELKVGDVKDDDSSTEVFGGVGGALNLGSHVDLYLEYLLFDADVQVDMFGLGVRVQF